MAAHEHLAAAQFHRREGRPTKHEHEAGGDEDTSAPKKIHVHEHKAHAPKRRGGHRG